MQVAKSAVAALGDHHALARLRHIGEHRAAFLVEHLRPDRNLQHRVGAAPAGAIATHSVHAGLGLEMLLVAKVDERVEAVRAFDHDVAAAPAVPAVGAAELDEFLAPERDRARPAIAGAHIDARLIEKLHRDPPLTARAPGRLPPRSEGEWRLPNPRGSGAGYGIRPDPPRAGAPCRPVPRSANPHFSSTGLRGLILDPDAR